MKKLRWYDFLIAIIFSVIIVNLNQLLRPDTPSWAEGIFGWIVYFSVLILVSI